MAKRTQIRPVAWASPALAFIMFWALVLLGAAPPQAGTPDPLSNESPKAVQKRAFHLWNLGRNEDAVRLLERLAKDHPDVRQGKSAFAHIGGWLENSLIIEADSLEKTSEILNEAARRYRFALEKTENQEAHISATATQALARIGVKRRVIDKIARGEIETGRSAELLGDMESSRAAAALMRESFDSGAENAATHIHLELIHQMDYLDAMYLRLEAIFKVTDESRPGESTPGFIRYAKLIDEAARDLIESAARAGELFGESDRALDYPIYHADAHGYRGGLVVLRKAAAKAGVIGSESFEGDAREQFDRALKIYEALAAEVDRRLAEPVKRPGQDRETLLRYRNHALEGAQNQKALIEQVRITNRSP